MIRKLEKTDVEAVAEIWLAANLKAHAFIPEEYWKNNFRMVKGMFLQAEMYVYEADKEIQGFIGMQGDYIAGIFVSEKMQSRGIGKQLLDFVKERKNKLQLNVYRKNTAAVRFYQREDFEIQSETIDKDTGEREYLMIWECQ